MVRQNHIYERTLGAFLKREFLRRKKRNPNYSMRAFAKFLELDQSYLSQVLRGQQIPSDKKLEKIGETFNLEEPSLERFRQSLTKLRKRRRQEKEKNRIFN